MQKKLLGMAVATALAAPAAVFAQSAVQVYGTAHMSFNSTKYGASTSGVAGVSKMAVNSHASNFGIRSSETLGGGMTGWVQYEFNVKMERDNDLTGANGSSRNSAIGLRGNFGNVYLGTWETPYASTFRMWDVGTIGGYGPTTSVFMRRESTGSAPSSNCGNVTGGGGPFTAPTTYCYHADAPGGGVGGTGVIDGVTVTAGGYALWRRYGSAVFYDSPNFSGFQFKIGYQPNETKSVAGAGVGPSGGTTTVVENPSSWSASLTWTGMGGKARAFFANMQAKDWSTVGQSDSGFTLGGGYDFGVVNLGGAIERFTYKVTNAGTARDHKVQEMAFGAAIPMGSGKIGVSYAVAKDMKVDGFGDVDNGGKMYNIGYEWALSKRTAVGFGYAAIKNDDAASFTWTGLAPNQTGVIPAALSGSDVSNIFVAVRHSF